MTLECGDSSPLWMGEEALGRGLPTPAPNLTAGLLFARGDLRSGLWAGSETRAQRVK
jgi:hypothetical protein